MKTKLFIGTLILITLLALFIPKTSRIEKLNNQRNDLEVQIKELQGQLSGVNQQIGEELGKLGVLGKEHIATEVHADNEEPLETGLSMSLSNDKTMYRNQEANPLPPVGGNTVAKRFENLVKYFGLDPIDFVKVRIAYKIPEEVVACVVWGDTGFTALKSAHNYGNVGNNDRGDIAEYGSQQEGLMAIGRVLNNKYLGKYTKIGELSQGGRTELGLPSCGNGNACYATSTYNWNANVLDCLSFVYGKKVNEDFIYKK